MSIGYNPDDFVWSTDLTTGRAAPRRGERDQVTTALTPERYRTDEKHPVVDSRGVLLPGKHPTPPAAPAAKPTTGDAGKEK